LLNNSSSLKSYMILYVNRCCLRDILVKLQKAWFSSLYRSTI